MRFAGLSCRTVPMSGLVRRVAGALVVVTGAVGAWPPAPAEAAVERVDMAGLRFTPPRVEIEVGDSVIWEAGDDGHTVTARDGWFDSSSRGLMGEGDQYRWRFRVPGTFGYFCRVHQKQGMQGQIVVVDPSGPTTSSRVTPVTAAATTSSTVPTATTAPTTTTTRRLATSSTTSAGAATATAPRGEPIAPQEPPVLNPSAPLVGSAGGVRDVEPAARRSGAEDGPVPYYVALGVLVALAAGAGGAFVRRGRRRAPSP